VASGCSSKSRDRSAECRLVNDGALDVAKLKRDQAFASLDTQLNAQKSAFHAVKTVVGLILARSAAGMRIARRADAA
jgi:hypothetical protein